MSATHKTSCAICAQTDLVRFLSLGDQPPANNFPTQEEAKTEARYPLDVYFCRSCNLAQLLDIVDADELFHHSYAYFSSASVPLVQHFEKYAIAVQKRFLKPQDLVVEIGSNDGVLLQFFKDTQRVLGIEPSENVAAAAREKGIETRSAFFTPTLAKEIVAQKGAAMLITANNVFAHIDDIGEIVEGVKELLHPRGAFIVEVHYLLDLLEKSEFDTVYHEHLYYYSLKSLQKLFEKFGIEIFDVERQPMHGGSIRVFVGHKGGHAIEKNVPGLLQLEKDSGLYDEKRFLQFGKEVEAARNKLVETVRSFRREGKRVVAYGAPAKGNTLLNYCGFTEADIEYVVDTTPHKVGRVTPGSHIPVVSPDILKKDPPDYILLLAWNYKNFILEKESDLRARGTRFIIPIPEVEIV